jgi:hypothetical protein
VTPQATPYLDQAEIKKLHLDPLNPRLPASIQGGAEPDLLKFIAETYDAIEIARSISRHGYFPSEPVIVIPQADDWLVVEGNRRLVALRILAEPALAGELDDRDEWEQLAASTTLPQLFPIVVAATREEVAPVIGYRHISGIEPWEPYAKARFIASLVENGASFSDVGDLVGEGPVDVAAEFRNYGIVKQAQDDFGVDARGAIRYFGVFTRAMTSQALREHVGAPKPADVHRDVPPLPPTKQSEIKEVLSWLFGDDSGNAPVIGESRDITDLGKVVGSADGLALLRQTRDLQAALAASGGLRERLLRRLRVAIGVLEASYGDIHAYADDEEVKELLDRCGAALEKLTNPDG